MRAGARTLSVAVLFLGFAAPACAPTGNSDSTSPSAAVSDGSQPETTSVPVDPLGEDLVLFDSDRTGSFEIYVMSRDGSGVQPLTDDSDVDSWWPRISPDRRQILFYRTPAGVHDTDFTKTSLWVMASDGSSMRELIPTGANGWDQHGHVEWLPDGTKLVMFAGSRSNPQIYVTSSNGSSPRQITDRGGVSIDPSFSPDGESIYFIGCPQAICFAGDYEVYSIPVDGGNAQRHTDDDLRDHDPYVSPDGESVAWLTQSSAEGPLEAWGIRIANVDGSNARWLINDGNINSKPDWTPDGSEIWFHRLVYGEDEAFSIYSISPDGEGLVEITSDQPGVNEFPDTGMGLSSSEG